MMWAITDAVSTISRQSQIAFGAARGGPTPRAPKWSWPPRQPPEYTTHTSGADPRSAWPISIRSAWAVGAQRARCANLTFRPQPRQERRHRRGRGYVPARVRVADVGRGEFQEPREACPVGRRRTFN